MSIPVPDVTLSETDVVGTVTLPSTAEQGVLFAIGGAGALELFASEELRYAKVQPGDFETGEPFADLEDLSAAPYFPIPASLGKVVVNNRRSTLTYIVVWSTVVSVVVRYDRSGA